MCDQEDYEPLTPECTSVRDPEEVPEPERTRSETLSQALRDIVLAKLAAKDLTVYGDEDTNRMAQELLQQATHKFLALKPTKEELLALRQQPVSVN